MPYFHITAVFEVQGTSIDEAAQTAASLFQSLRHNRVHYYEHDVSAGIGPYSPSKTLYFSALAEFDAEAGTEERAGEMTEEVLEALATDEIQLVAFGLTQGERRTRSAAEPPPLREGTVVESAPKVEPKPRVEPLVQIKVVEPVEPIVPPIVPVQAAQAAKPVEAAELVEAVETVESLEAEEPPGKKRASRGRSRKRKAEPEAEISAEAVETSPVEAISPRDAEPEPEAAPPVVVTAPVITGVEGILTTPVDVVALASPDELPAAPPPRSSTAMRVQLTLSFRAAELGLPANGFGFHDKDDLLARGIAEARVRHPELPQDVTPEHAVIVQPWGDVSLTLTWEYDAPVPSALEES